MTAQPVKFLFDRRFDEPEIEDEPTVSLAEHARLIEAAKASAFAEGIAEGRRQSEQTIEAQFVAGVPALQGQISAILTQIDTAIDTHAALAAELAAAIARTMAPNLIAREPLAELTRLFEDCVSELRTVPHLAVRVNDALVDQTQHRLAPIAESAGFSGRLIVLGDPDILIGDCRIDWAEGGIARALSDLDRTVRERVKTYIATRKSGRTTDQ